MRSGIEDAAAYQIHRTNRLLLTHLARFLHTHDSELSPEKYSIIMKLHESGPLPMSALVEVALDDGPNVSRLIDRLVTAGLVNRNEDPNDRRARVLELTAAGSSLAQRVKADTPQERSVVFDGISKTDLKKLTTILESLNNNVRPSLTTKAPQ